MKFCPKGCLWDHHQPAYSCFQVVQILQLQGSFEEIPVSSSCREGSFKVPRGAETSVLPGWQVCSASEQRRRSEGSPVAKNFIPEYPKSLILANQRELAPQSLGPAEGKLLHCPAASSIIFMCLVNREPGL